MSKGLSSVGEGVRPSVSSSTLISDFTKDGYVVIDDCVSESILTELRSTFATLMAQKIIRTGIKAVTVTDGRQKSNEGVKIDFDPQGGNHDLNRWNMHLPSTSTFLRDEIIANPKILPLLDALVGSDQVLFIIASDTPYPGSAFQNIHQDFPRFGLTVNIPLIDFTEENGPLEVWPGSHVRNAHEEGAFHTGSVNLSSEEIQAIRANTPVKRCLIKAGSILIRDQRLVHRGTANLTNEPRPCLSLWYKGNAGFMRPMELNIPIPHRTIADMTVKIALRMRESGRHQVQLYEKQNKTSVNLGSLLGRLVEEFSASDRDYRRTIPADILKPLSTRSRHLLRFSASTSSNQTQQKTKSDDAVVATHGSIVGSMILILITFIFVVIGLFASVFGRGKKRSV